MASATVTSKGQITIPVEVRTELGLKAGDRIEFLKNEQGRFSIFPTTGSVRDLKGILGKFDRVISVEEMNEAVAIRGSRIR